MLCSLPTDRQRIGGGWFAGDATDPIGLGIRSQLFWTQDLNTRGGSSYKAGGQGMASISGRSPLEIIKEAVRARNRRLILDAITPFYVFRTDNQQVLARGLLGYDAAREKANQIRRQQGLKWDQVSFKSERKPSSTSALPQTDSRSRVDVARNYNPSKRTHFKGRYDKDGNFHDLD